jgi:hypothetical protein
VATLVVEELRVFFLADPRLHRIEGLFHEHAILDIEDAIGVTF